MKAAVIYYSYTGNTKRVADILAEHLKGRCYVDIFELHAPSEPASFCRRAVRALLHRRTEIVLAEFDLCAYDLICFGSPVWAFAPAPAMNAYLDKCPSLADKSAVLFVTYGSGAGVDRCLGYMQKVISKKGVREFRRFSVQQLKVKDKEFVGKVIGDNLK